MGLDMNFYKRTYLTPKKERTEDFDLKYPDVRVQEYDDIDGNRNSARIHENVTYVVSKIGDFRKANAIHQFIVDRCWGQDDPNCQLILVPRETMKELKYICQTLLSIKDQDEFEKQAEELLPTQSGFFFGSLEYDDYYRDCLKHAVEMIDAQPLDDDSVDYIYRCWY